MLGGFHSAPPAGMLPADGLNFPVAAQEASTDDGRYIVANKNVVTRRRTLQAASALGTSALLGSVGGVPASCSPAAPDWESNARANPAIARKVFQTPLIDRHANLIEAKGRLPRAPRTRGTV